MASTTPFKVRSMYRAILRELPHRPLSAQSPLQSRIRQRLATPANEKATQEQLERADQIAQYARAQRMYATLLERYNPGADMTEEERVRLTARRVGMELPVEVGKNNGNTQGQ